MHDTSIAMIERTYSENIAEHSDELFRAAQIKRPRKIRLVHDRDAKKAPPADEEADPTVGLVNSENEADGLDK